ncbi:leucine-rich repeat protein (LRRP), putative [Trypanosoma equiperdum]|uniref:Leucine-rich repeat protein (LRRP) n=4 Tax=Trypanozoon TaxID=39700 RepID=Q38B07_TRYB2|nr:hypothetical protein, conserved [Trypanosoma brucei gambiense DAL972]XP_822841.1 hypothetical protein, conserved [Trypanosoma brucei brucei TREU927]RHW69803.1 leucine-rich repeat protein (LRRP) [Trypanosoma brucei equiperdum]SCU66442.1 leucine-rich repeat protein (LRRP), putative [Trypanosoma equiperdum]EAN78013.1 hypothetical protein, conserved [Trypanosoma brucei brucei TREU927]CBH15645.1 hypothetical protein, conserved [Trypanosoma brucei gambiense DAL972]|eukprot:XP_011777909.1 hypothetical protein, conserved [Trypanosoma brucei gambiense DAL972]
MSTSNIAPEDPGDVPLEVENPLTYEVVKESLSALSSNADGWLVYAQAKLCSLSLTSIDLLSSYVHLQRLSLDDNRLVTLKPLRSLCCLIHFSAAGNALTNDVFDDLASSSVTLERLNLDRNALTSLGGLSKLPFLMDFSAAENGITELHADDFSLLHSLTRLNLKLNKISRVNLDTFSKCLTVRALNLSYNSIVDKRFVVHLAGNLESLNLEHNAVEGFSDFDVLHSLVFLFLSNNNIQNWDGLEGLSKLKNIRVLTLEGNPVLRSHDGTTSGNSSSLSYEAHVQQDVDFAACRSLNVSTQKEGMPLPTVSSALLTSLTAPQVRSIIHHLPAAPYGDVQWEVDGNHELSQLPYEEQCRFRVISMMPQLQVLDSTEVHAGEIPRAMRLFCKEMKSAEVLADARNFPSGSGLKAIGLHRLKSGSKYMT